MICPECKVDNPDKNKFCSECGISLTEIPATLTSPPIEDEEVTEKSALDFAPGQYFGKRYQIIEELGRGGMGRIYKAVDKELNKAVALKMIKPELSDTHSMVERFKKELVLARKVTHKNVCRIHDLGEIKGIRFISMQYIEGQDLNDFIKQSGQLTNKKALSITKQICEALQAAHNEEVIHRDLKPQNIMVDKKGNAYVMDFGIARSLESEEVTKPGVVIGTPHYMSPEQGEGKTADIRSDIYSLGCILYEMLTGKPPFEADTAPALIHKHLKETPEPPSQLNPQISPSLESIILKFLEKDPKKRYQGAGELLPELSEILKGIPTPEKIIPKRMAITSKEITVTFGVKKLIIPAVVLAALAAVIILSVFLIKNLLPKKHIPPAHKQLTFTGNASYPAISPDGKFIAYVNSESFDQQKIMVKDVVSGQAIEVFRAKVCEDLRWTPDSSELSFTADMQDSSYGTFIIPLLGGTPRRLQHSGLLTWSPDGSQYARGWTGEKEIRITDKSTDDTTTIPLKGSFLYLKALDWSPADKFLLFLTIDGQERYAIWTITTDGKAQHKVFEEDVPLFSPRWSPRGDAIFYLRSRGQAKELWKIQISPDTGKSTKSESLVLIGLQAGDYFTINGDGKKLLYTREVQYSNLWLATVEGLGKDQKVETKQLTTGTLMNKTPSISPDGSLIAFSRGDGEKGNIYVMPIKGGSPQQITFFDSLNYGAVWSPDGKEIAFGSNQGGIYKVWKINADGGKPFQFVRSQLSGDSFTLAWFPGQNILYHRPGNRNFHVLNPTTEEESPLVEDDSVGWMFDPEYSPDGKRVAVFWNRRPFRGIWLISFEDSSQQFIRKDVTPIGWSSDGKWIYFAEEMTGTLKILRIALASDQAEKFLTVPLALEKGEPNYWDVSMTPDGKHFVFPVAKIHSDVWVVENFDPEMK